MIKTVSSWSKKDNKCNRTEEWKGHHRYTWKIVSLRPGKGPAGHTNRTEKKGSTTVFLLLGRWAICTNMCPLLKLQLIYYTQSYDRLSGSVNQYCIYCGSWCSSLKSSPVRDKYLTAMEAKVFPVTVCGVVLGAISTVHLCLHSSQRVKCCAKWMQVKLLG